MQNEQTTCTVCIDFWNRQSCARVHARAVENMIWLWTAQLKVEGRCQSKDSRIARDQHLTDERWELLLGDGHDIPDLCLRDRYTCELLMLYHLAGFAQECLAFWGAVSPGPPRKKPSKEGHVLCEASWPPRNLRCLARDGDPGDFALGMPSAILMISYTDSK